MPTAYYLVTTLVVMLYNLCMLDRNSYPLLIATLSALHDNFWNANSSYSGAVMCERLKSICLFKPIQMIV